MDKDIIWDLDDEPEGNVWHIAEHGLTKDDVREAVASAVEVSSSHSTGRPILFGYTSDGRYVAVVYEVVDDDTIYPVTAYEPEERP